MKTILLWDLRFPDRKPTRLTVDDTIASAAVRSGAAAAADPAQAGALAAGGALDPGNLTDVVLQHGVNNSIRRVVLPLSVVAIGLALGLIAKTGTILATGNLIPIRALTFADGTPLQFSDGTFLEFAA